MVSKEIIQRIVKNTSLDEFEARIYSLFCESANLTRPAIIMYDSVQQNISSFIQQYNVTILDEAGLYNFYEQEFIEKNLLGYTDAGNNYLYPYVKGYNYFNDPEVFATARVKGNTSWNARVPVNSLFNPTISHQEPYWSLHQNFEFKDKWINDKLREQSN